MEKKPFWSGPKKPAAKPASNVAANQGSVQGNTQGNRRGVKGNKNDGHAINDQIRASEVRLVGDNVENGIYSISQAMRMADELELDLIEISATATPPVCRILDYQKFLYQQRKRLKEQKAKSTKVVVKEIRFGPQTDDHDYNFKLKHAQEFLKEGSKVKAYVFFRGRSILFKEQGEVLLLRFANDLEDYGRVEMMPVLEGKRMTIMLSPKKGSSSNKSESKSQPKAESKQPESE